MINYYRTKHGLVTRIYNNQILHSKNRKHRLPTYTRLELKQWLYDQKLWHELYLAWVESDFNKMDAPSCDRTDDELPYCLSRLSLKKWRENKQKQSDDFRSGKLYNSGSPHKAVIATNNTTKQVIEFISMSDADRTLGISFKNISAVCRNKRKSAGGYSWKFKHQ